MNAIYCISTHVVMSIQVNTLVIALYILALYIFISLNNASLSRPKGMPKYYDTVTYMHVNVTDLSFCIYYIAV